MSVSRLFKHHLKYSHNSVLLDGISILYSHVKAFKLYYMVLHKIVLGLEKTSKGNYVEDTNT